MKQVKLMVNLQVENKKSSNKLNHIAPNSTRFIFIPTHSVRMR
ncbi:hypothetical protein [uncultured Gammaproteobacteria bacterium]|nr:hypothetical protein [uncultured Gammaproteobacteria bacterium]CAC9576281.1 hypothetical protein [uncultured Gammaproteobacteria bacterium]